MSNNCLLAQGKTFKKHPRKLVCCTLVPKAAIPFSSWSVKSLQWSSYSDSNLGHIGTILLSFSFFFTTVRFYKGFKKFKHSFQKVGEIVWLSILAITAIIMRISNLLWHHVGQSVQSIKTHQKIIRIMMITLEIA